MLLHCSNYLRKGRLGPVQTFLLITTFLTPLAASAGSHDQAVGPAAVVSMLYRDFAWEALSSDTTFGAPLAEQPRPVLERYFDSALATLLINDAMCEVRSKGDACNLEFDVIFASQDPSASDLEITSSGTDRVAVSFAYPGNGKKIHLEYVMAHTRSGWRIKDVIYHDWNDQSLVRVLSKSQR